MAQVFSCEFFEFLKNTFFYTTPPVSTSVLWLSSYVKLITNSWEHQVLKFFVKKPFEGSFTEILKRWNRSVTLWDKLTEAKSFALKDHAMYHYFIMYNVQRHEACNFLKKVSLAQVFSYEFCEIFKDSFVIEQLWWLLLNVSIIIRYP